MSASLDPPDDPPAPDGSLDPAQQAEFQKAIEDWKQASDQGNVEQEEALGMRLLALALEHATQNPSPDDQWHDRIAAAQDALEWEESIALRREHIEWKRRHDPHGTRWKDLTELSRLLWMCGQRNEAAAMAAEAVGCANESGLSAAPMMTVPVAARYAVALGRSDEAEQMVEVALAEVESPGRRADGITDQLTLPLRLCQARLTLARGDLLLTQRQLDRIWPEIERYADSQILAGWRSRHAEHAELSGRLHLARGELSAAIAAFERALLHWQSVLQMPQINNDHFVQCSMARMLMLMAEALAPTQPQAADDLRQQAREVFASLRLPPGS